MSRKRIALIAASVALAAAVVALLLDVSSEPEAAPRAPRIAAASGATTIVDQPITPTRLGARRTAAEGDADGGGGAEATAGPREYVRDDGTLVRDHRGAGAKVPRAGRPVSAASMLQVRNDIQPLIKECGRELRRRAPGLRGKMQADVTISVHDERIRIDTLDLQVQGLDDSEYPACVRKALEGRELDAPAGQANVDGHTLSLPFKVP